MIDNTNAERQARWRAKRDEDLTAAQAEIERLRKAEAAPSSDSPELIEARAEIEQLRKQLAEAKARIQQMADERMAQALAQAKHDRKADREVDREVDRRIELLQTENKNLRQKVEGLKHLTSASAERLAHSGMDFKTKALIAKALHPDATPSHNDRETAFKAFSAWKSDSKDDAAQPMRRRRSAAT